MSPIATITIRKPIGPTWYMSAEVAVVRRSQLRLAAQLRWLARAAETVSHGA